MQESAFSFHNLEHPAPGTDLPAGRHRLRGWIVPKDGGNFVDVRVWVGNRLFPAVHGVPRADLAAFFKTGATYALAEFQAEIDLEPGAADLRFEALDLQGQWREFLRSAHLVTPPHAPSPVPPIGSAYRWHDFCRGLDAVLRARRRQPEASWTALADEVATTAPFPRDLRIAERPFVGFLDEPAAVNDCRFGRVPVIGYVFHTTQPIKRLTASADLQLRQALDYGQARPDVAAAYSPHAYARTSGYQGYVDIPTQLPAPVAIRLYAELDDGTLHFVHALRTHLHDEEEEKFAYAPGDFDAALAAWRAALVRRQIPVIEDADFLPGVERLRVRHRDRMAAAAPRPASPLRAHSSARHPLPRRTLLVTHNLNFEGAPLFLLEYARHLAAAGIHVEVLSPLDGPLRTAFAQAGMRVRLIDVSAVLAASDSSSLRAALAAIPPSEFAGYDLVVCNTFTTFWAVHAARAADRRVLMYIHESTTPAAFYAGRITAVVVRAVEEAFALADVVSFTTDSTRRYHLDYGRPENHRLTSGWVNVPAIDRWLDTHPRESLRESFSLAPDELLVTNVGTVSERKGQHLFVRAVDLLWRRHPTIAARTRFVMLGSRDSDFDRALRTLIESAGRPNLVLHTEAANYLRYYAAADLTVCSSFEESSPRVVLEAMACGTPLLASAVHGIPEIARPGREATLVPPGDTWAWCEALAELLTDPAPALSRASRARERVATAFSADVILPQHLALAAAVAAGDT